MNQKSMSIEESIEKGAILKPQVFFKPTFEKEVTLRNVVEDFAKAKGVKISNIDKLASNLLFSIDGNLMSSIKNRADIINPRMICRVLRL